MTECGTAQVDVRFRQAVMALRRLEPADHVRFNRYRCAWPESAQTEEARRLAYGYEAAAETTTRPSVFDLRFIDEVMGWCCRYLNPDTLKQAGLPKDSATLLWLRAENVPWSYIQKVREDLYAVSGARGARRRGKRRGGGRSLIPGGNSRTSLVGLHNRILVHLAGGLNADRIEVVVGARPIDAEPVEAAPLREQPRSMPRTVERVLEELDLESPLLVRTLVSVVLADKTPRGTEDLRRAKQFIDREIGRRASPAPAAP